MRAGRHEVQMRRSEVQLEEQLRQEHRLAEVTAVDAARMFAHLPDRFTH